MDEWLIQRSIGKPILEGFVEMFKVVGCIYYF